jgi:hypothetical protein
MRALINLVVVASVIVLAGCPTDVKDRVSCSTNKDCLDASKGLYDDFDASAAFLPQCCASVCVVPATACDSGLRYLTSRPALGQCTSGVMCPVPPDMSVPADMTGWSIPDMPVVDASGTD